MHVHFETQDDQTVVVISGSSLKKTIRKSTSELDGQGGTLNSTVRIRRALALGKRAS